ncbi:MAG: hypothetical protein IIB00_07735 [candidate division Zixibacteria bacterium]|nr:hypothetical protein [candidate division Zixibacteria bacterium]
MTAWLLETHGIVSLGALGFENAYALALPRNIADSLSIITLADLAPHTSSMVMGADYVFFDRPEWKNARDVYRLNFKELRAFDPTLMYTAVRVGEVDVISAYSTDGRNVEYDLLVLEDPLQSLPPYDAALLLSPKIIGTPGLESSLMALIGKIDDDMMRKANKMVDSDGLSVRKAAAMLRAEALQGHKK